VIFSEAERTYQSINHSIILFQVVASMFMCAAAELDEDVVSVTHARAFVTV